MASTPLSLKIIEASSVAPPPGTTPGRASLRFTYFDIFWIALPPVERLFFYHYPHSTDHFVSSLLPSLKSSLSLALKTYYPLAGGSRQIPGTENKYEHCYVEGDAVSFTVAECNGAQFEHLASDCERDVSQLNCLAPQLPKSEEVQPLLAVQVTVFPGQGIVIGTSVHHTACDGTSSMQFMHTWAETCLSGASVSSRVPSFDRTLISDPSDNYSSLYNQVREIIKSPPKHATPPNSELILATFRLGQDQIQRLKKLVLANSKTREERKTSFRCSTIVVAFAYVWTGFIRAKRVDSTKRVCIGIPADFRARIQPPLPTEYFGNCVGSCMAIANVADLIQEDGFIAAAEAVGKAIDQLADSQKAPKNWLDGYASFSGTPVIGIAGSPKFKVYDVDFGVGRPKKVEIVSATKTSAMAVADSRDEQGGVEIGFAFPKDEMDCFKKYFFDGLKLISD